MTANNDRTPRGNDRILLVDDEEPLARMGREMPRMAGAEPAAELIRIRPELPLILVTGFSETVQREDAGRIGIGEYLMKPVVARELAEAVRRVLDREQPMET